jgi:YfiR/HmsC-like
VHWAVVQHGRKCPRRAYWRRWVGLVACCLACAAARPASAQQAADDAVINREYPLKALFLYNFGGYVEWPSESFPTSQAPFAIGVLGSAPIEATLKELAATKTIAGRRIVVERFSSLDDLRPCHILFVTRNVSGQQQRMALERLQDQPVLIVGESEGFAALGGSVNFIVESNKIRFEINVDAAKQHQLKISSKLLALAKIVPDHSGTSKGSAKLNP